MLLVFQLQSLIGYSQDFEFSNPYRPVYDTFALSPVMKEDIGKLEQFRDSVFAQAYDSLPDTTVHYQLRFYGTCNTSWPQYLHRDVNPGYGPCRCSLGHDPRANAHVDIPKIYTFKQLQHLGQVWVFGNRYAVMRTVMIVRPGNATDFGSFWEYYLEKLE